MAGTIWTQRRAGDVASATRPGVSETEHLVIIDPSLSPDWIAIPNDPNVPAELRGVLARVGSSHWTSPAWTAALGLPEQRTRWHVLKTRPAMLVAELTGHGAAFILPGPDFTDFTEQLRAASVDDRRA